MIMVRFRQDLGQRHGIDHRKGPRTAPDLEPCSRRANWRRRVAERAFETTSWLKPDSHCKGTTHTIENFMPTEPRRILARPRRGCRLEHAPVLNLASVKHVTPAV